MTGAKTIPAPRPSRIVRIGSRRFGTQMLDLAHLPDIDLAKEMTPGHNRGTMSHQWGTWGPGQTLDRPSWYGGLENIDQAIGIAREGWREGSDKVAEVSRAMRGDAQRLSAGIVSNRRRKKWSDQGDTLDRERVLAGDLDRAWLTTARDGQGIAPIVSIVFGWGGNAGRDADELVYSGAAALVAADYLTQAGYSVEVVALSVADQGGATYSATGVKLKKAGEPMRLQAVASAACHPGIFRTLLFAWRCTSAVSVREGMGSTSGVTGFTDDELNSLGVEGTPIVLPHAYDMDQALDNVRAVFARFQGR